MEAKYVNAESRTFAEQDSFYDTLFIAADNAFIPDELQPVVAQTGGLLLTQDPTDLSDNNPIITERETLRFVGGLEWETDSGHNFEVSFNHGQFKNTQDSSEIYLDRQFAATDAVRAPDGFVTANVTDSIKLTQTVVSGLAAGEFDLLQGMLDGPIGYAAGLEYRREASEAKNDPLRLGILPQGTSLTPGVLANSIDPFLNSFISIDNDQIFNTSGSYDVKEVFGEVRFPIFRDQPFFEELTLDAAVRYADYNTIGGQTTWKIGGTWVPIDQLSLRGTLSKAVRAPNIAELFDPELPIQIGSNEDPCDPDNISLGTSDRQQNCVAGLQAAGVDIDEILDANGDYIWENPLTGRFTGVSGGNPNLQAETADTFTVGAVFRPTIIDGFSVTVDYWDINIENAIQAVLAADILDGCHDSASFPAVPSCDQFTRRADGGLNFLSSQQINFAALEASGVDFSANYKFDWAENTLGARLVGSYQDKLNRFFNPSDLTEVNPDIQEVQTPELTGNLLLSWQRGPMNVGFQTTYQSKQFLAPITAAQAAGAADSDPDTLSHFQTYLNGDRTNDVFIFDVNGSYEFNDQFTIYGGVNNIADKDPFSTQTAWPVGPRGRFVFLGVNYKM